ncbi:MAG: winged helix-turn-helix transcriptional regulator [Chloroflexi bacterium]|nr:winged helix-turn-helix transcriptional regulator [Chloroflexota bacterium]
MIQVHINPTHLENIRFGYSPLLELAFSFHTLLSPKVHADHDDWSEKARRALHGYSFPYLEALISSPYYLADIVTPTPRSASPGTFEAQLNDLRNTPPSVIRRDVETVVAYTSQTGQPPAVPKTLPIQQEFLVNPHEAVGCLIEELVVYWRLALAPTWSKSRAVLEQDILYRAREGALRGISHTLGTLTPRVEYHRFTLTIHKPHRGPFARTEYTLSDEAFYLVPSLFKACDGVSWQLETDLSPMIIYGARGQGLWRRSKLPEPEKQLIQAFGVSRARVLLALRTPITTMELGRRLGIAGSSISQHLKRLRAAGLVESHRSGQYVYYQLTRRGDTLLTVFETAD